MGIQNKEIEINIPGLDGAKELYIKKVSFGTSTRLSIYKKIADFVKNSVPLNDSLSLLAEEYKKNNPSDPRAYVLNIWLKKMRLGKTFSEAIQGWAPTSEIILIKAGEKNGDLNSAFANAISTTEASKNMISTLKSELSYPIILLLALFALVYMFSVNAIPTLVDVKDPRDWPDMSKKLYALSIFVQNYWWMVLMGIGAIGTLSIISLSRLTGKSRKILDKIPPWSIYRSFQGSIFLVSIASMMRTGTPLVEAIEEIFNDSNDYVKSHLRIFLKGIANGQKVGEAMDTNFLEKESHIDISIYEKNGSLQGNIGNIGISAIENGLKNIKSASGILKNIILGMLAGYVGWVYLAFFTLTQGIATGTG